MGPNSHGRSRFGPAVLLPFVCLAILGLAPGCGTVLTGVALALLLQPEEEEPVPPGPDTTPPAAIADLSATTGASSGSVTLGWTAPGDDGTSGGPVASYLVKYSTAAITAGNFASASTYNQGWTPVSPGLPENHAIYSLTPGQTYYFAVVSVDEVPNVSAISNVPSAVAFTGADTVAPSPITDLAASPGASAGTIALSWTATGDDGNTGTAASYVVKTSTSAITAANFDLAATYAQGWTPLAAGGAEAHTLAGFTPGQTIHVAVKVLDEVPNTSAISNVASAVATTGADTVAPSAIADLAAATGTSQGTIDLTWTATGDDGSLGTANGYLVKVSTSLIDGANFDAATTVAQTWTPAGSGTGEAKTLSGLTPGQLYYVAIKARDEASNWSGISNVPSATASTAADTIAPSAIADLAASTGSSTGTIDLQWTATGDDGAVGTATSYVVKYSTAAITGANFDSATTYAQTWGPQGAGQTESYTLTGLTGGTTYWVAIKVRDEAPNESAISNVPSAVASNAPDTTPPAAVTDLAASTGTSNGQIDITFTASGDDGGTGTATSYVVKYALGPITSANFDAATTFVQSWAPRASGQTETFTLSGLTAGWTYNVAIKVRDEVPNTSAISNVANATVASGADTCAPAAITDLAATGSLARGSVDLTWTAVGDDGNTGTATSYEVRYSTSAITAGNWASATVFGQLWTPKAAGQTEAYTVSGLTPETTYYFAIKARDEVPNTSGVSNSPSTAPLKAWTWMHPLPSTYCPTCFWANSASDVWGGGTGGALLHYDGSSWTRTSSGVTAYIYAMWGSSTSDVFAGCSNGTILHFDGQHWSTMNSGLTAGIMGMWGSSSTNVYAVSGGGTFAHYNGTSWSTVSLGTSDTLNCIWGTSANDIWIPSSQGDYYHFDGSSWNRTSPAIGQAGSIWGSASNNYFAGVGGYIFRYNGTNWSQSFDFGSSDAVRAIWGASSTSVFACSNNGFIRRFDGSNWQTVTSGTTHSLRGIGGSSASDVFFGGGDVILLHYDGSSCTNQGQSLLGYSNPFLYSVWGSSSSDVYAVGSDGSQVGVLHFDGTSWSRINLGLAFTGQSVCGTSASDVFVVGSGGNIQHYDGSNWTSQSSGTTNTLYRVWAAASNDVFAVGSSGTILHYNGSSWSAMSSGTTNLLWSVWGMSGNYVLAVGRPGTILLYNGTNWSAMTSGTSQDIYDVCGSSMTDVYAVGDLGTMLHYDGTTWSSTGPSISNHLRGVHAFASNDVYVVGFDGRALHFNGSNWSDMAREKGTGDWYWEVWGPASGSLFAVGNGGAIHRHP